jgi:hypothetical protein
MAITALRGTERASQTMMLEGTAMRLVMVTRVRRDAERYSPLLG